MIYDKVSDMVYESTLSALEYKKSLPNFDIDEIKNELNSLYIYEGHGWAGRGLIKEAEIGASIAAYQAFLSNNK